MHLHPKEGTSCPRCPLFEAGIPVRDRDTTNNEVKLVAVGEMPGKEEVKLRMVFTGASGKMLDGMFSALEMPTPYITNAIRCGLPRGAKLSAKEMKLASECCYELTMDTLGFLGPKVVMAIGGSALEHLKQLSGIEKYRGCCWAPTEEHPWITTCTIHPAGILRQEERRIWIELLRDDIAKASGLGEGKRTLWLPDVRDAANVEELVVFLEDLWKLKEATCDVETTGLDALTCSLRTIGIGNAERAYSIPWPVYFKGYWRPADWRRVWTLLKDIFTDEEMHLVFSNKIYDVSVLRQSRYFGDKLRCICDDVLLRHHAVYPKLPHDLQSMSSQFLAIPPWKSEFQDAFGEWGSDEDRHNVDKAASLFWYNACDVQATAADNDALKPLVISHGVEKVYDCDRQLVDVAIDFYRRGVLIDVDELHRLARVYRSGDEGNPGVLDKLDSLVQGYAYEVGMPGFNPDSPKQLAELLYKRLKLPATALTETGQISTAKEQLYKIFHRHPIVPALMKFRKEKHLYSTYLIGLEKKLHDDGRLHSVGNIASTPTGRFGFTPAVQNWPKGQKTGEINMKRMMVATPGTKYVGADYSALELRFIALLAGERRLIDLFMNDVDVHSVHAEKFFGAAFRKADAAGRKVLRDRSKPVTFGKDYGAGAETLFEQILPDRLDEDPEEVFREVKHMSDTFDGMYPMILAAGDYLVRYAQENRNLRTMLAGRLRKFPLGSASLTVAKNHPVQGGAADVMNLATLRWIDELKRDGVYWTRVWPTLQIHDFLAAEVLEEYAEEEAERLARCLYTELTYHSPVSNTTNMMKFPAETFVADTAAGKK